jgi:hypothetical protein
VLDNISCNIRITSVGKRSFGRPRSRWEDDIKIYLRAICCEDGRWVEAAQYRVHWRAFVLAVLNFLVLLPQCHS